MRLRWYLVLYSSSRGGASDSNTPVSDWLCLQARTWQIRNPWFYIRKSVLEIVTICLIISATSEPLWVMWNRRWCWSFRHIVTCMHTVKLRRSCCSCLLCLSLMSDWQSARCRVPALRHQTCKTSLSVGLRIYKESVALLVARRTNNRKVVGSRHTKV